MMAFVGASWQNKRTVRDLPTVNKKMRFDIIFSRPIFNFDNAAVDGWRPQTSMCHRDQRAACPPFTLRGGVCDSGEVMTCL